MQPINSPRVPLGFFPTPLVHLKRFSAALNGPQILIKRDDLTGLALGGNKTRKLEFLLGEAIQRGADCVITGGAAQSNHCRQTAAAAASQGLKCHLVLGGEAPQQTDGNLLLDQLLGAQIHWSGEQRKGEQIPQIAAQLEQSGLRPYIVPYGGSNSTGALGFVAAIDELAIQLSAQEQTIQHILFASSSGGTQAGMMVGVRRNRLDCQVMGIAIDKEGSDNQPFAQTLLELTRSTAERLGEAADYTLEQISLREEFLGAGYGVVGNLERHAIELLARSEGVLLDPVYSGRAMGGLIRMIEQGEFSPDDRVLFWHTGGTPALFPYARDLVTPG